MTTPVPSPPKGKANRQKVLIAGAGLVLLVFLFMRSRGAQTAAPATEDPNAGQTVAQPATFADNGAQAASLGDSVTSGLGAVAGSLQDEQLAFQTLADALNANAGTTPAAPTTPSSTVGQGNPDPATIPGKPPGNPLPALSVGDSKPQSRSLGGLVPSPGPKHAHPTPPPSPRPPKHHRNAGHKAPHHTLGGGGSG
jgi:hypothetical protein